MNSVARILMAFVVIIGSFVVAQEQQPEGVLITTTDPAFPGCTEFVSFSDSMTPNCETQTTTEKTSVIVPVTTSKEPITVSIAPISTTGTTTPLLTLSTMSSSTAPVPTSVIVPVTTEQETSTVSVKSISTTSTTTSLPTLSSILGSSTTMSMSETAQETSGQEPSTAGVTPTSATGTATSLLTMSSMSTSTTPAPTSLVWTASFVNSSNVEISTLQSTLIPPGSIFSSSWSTVLLPTPSMSETPVASPESTSHSTLASTIIPSMSTSETSIEPPRATTSTSSESFYIPTVSTILVTDLSTLIVTSTSVVWVSSTSVLLSVEPSTIDHTTTITTTTTEPALPASSPPTYSLQTVSESPDGQVVGPVPTTSSSVLSISTPAPTSGRTTVSCRVIGNHVSTLHCITSTYLDSTKSPGIPTTFSTVTRGVPQSPNVTCISTAHGVCITVSIETSTWSVSTKLASTTSGTSLAATGPHQTLTSGGQHPHHTKSKGPMSSGPSVIRDPYTVTTTMSGHPVVGDVLPGQDGSMTTSWHTTGTKLPVSASAGGIHTVTEQPSSAESKSTPTQHMTV